MPTESSARCFRLQLILELVNALPEAAYLATLNGTFILVEAMTAVPKWPTTGDTAQTGKWSLVLGHSFLVPMRYDFHSLPHLRVSRSEEERCLDTRPFGKFHVANVEQPRCLSDSLAQSLDVV